MSGSPPARWSWEKTYPATARSSASRRISSSSRRKETFSTVSSRTASDRRMGTVQSMMDLTGRRALITGGAGHIGFAAAQALTELGARVALLDLDATSCSGRAGELNRGGKDVALPV